MDRKYDDLPIIEQVPEYHMRSPQSKVLIEAMTDHSLKAREAVLDVVNQFWVYTATWGLDLWEELLDIETNHAQSYDTRRAAIVAKMCGSGVCNADMIRSIVLVITGYETVVTEHFSECRFSLSFVGETPALIDVDRAAIIDAVEMVKPAHLMFVIEDITWDDLEVLGYTWDDLHAQNLTWNDLCSKVMVHKQESADGGADPDSSFTIEDDGSGNVVITALSPGWTTTDDGSGNVVIESLPSGWTVTDDGEGNVVIGGTV